jgi:hypothetical protein
MVTTQAYARVKAVRPACAHVPPTTSTETEL